MELNFLDYTYKKFNDMTNEDIGTNPQVVVVTLNEQGFEKIVQSAVDRAFEQWKSKTNQEQEQYAEIPTYCSRKELAKILGMHWQTIRTWEAKGYLVRERFGAAIRYSRQSVITCLEQMRDLPYHKCKNLPYYKNK